MRHPDDAEFIREREDASLQVGCAVFGDRHFVFVESSGNGVSARIPGFRVPPKGRDIPGGALSIEQESLSIKAQSWFMLPFFVL